MFGNLLKQYSRQKWDIDIHTILKLCNIVSSNKVSIARYTKYRLKPLFGVFSLKYRWNFKKKIVFYSLFLLNHSFQRINIFSVIVTIIILIYKLKCVLIFHTPHYAYIELNDVNDLNVVLDNGFFMNQSYDKQH